MGNAFIVVWRESLEALLIVGIVHAWLKVNDPSGRGTQALWGGVAVGLGLAALLGYLISVVQDELAETALEAFQAGMLIVACLLVTHMVLWMARHGREMKKHLEQGAARARDAANWIGLATVVALAIAREGAETAIFLYGLAMSGQGEALALGAGAGLAAGLATGWGVSRGLRFFPTGPFLRISGGLLLVFAAALLAAGVEKLIGQGWLPALADQLWDSSRLLDDSAGAGKIFADFTGYRAHPSLMLALIYCAYWASVLSMKARVARHG